MPSPNRELALLDRALSTLNPTQLLQVVNAIGSGVDPSMLGDAIIGLAVRKNGMQFEPLALSAPESDESETDTESEGDPCSEVKF
jgi:hypothetical protein